MKKLFPLKPKVKVNSDFYVFDTETGIFGKEFDHKKSKLGKGQLIKWKLQATQDRFIFGVVYGRNFTKVIHSLKELQDEFKEPRYKDKTVFAHNFGRYDGSVLYGNIFDLDAEAIFIGSRFISCTNGNCRFADSLNVYKASVKEMGLKMGKLKLGMDDGNYKQSIWPVDKVRDINGCIRDCEIVWNALLEIFEEAGDVKITIGSLAMTYFRRYAMDMWIEANDNVKHFWQSYYGGRTEAFKIGNTHAKVIDVNSLYPDMMKNTTFPNPKFLKHEKLTDVKFFISNILSHYEGCATVTILHPVMYIGLLPYRHNGKLMFPCGNFAGSWNFNELRYAIKQGCKILTIKDCTYSEKMSSPFVKFVDKLGLGKFEAKVSGRMLDELKYKNLLVNLYGKFAQRIDEKTIYINDIVEQYDLIKEHQRKGTFIKLLAFNQERSDAFLIVKTEKKIEIAYSMPSFSSYITSAGRIKLAEKLLSMQGNRPVYCDTDSIFFEVDDGVESSNVLGEWKVEDKIVTEIRGLKNYSYESYSNVSKKLEKHSRIKGVPSKRVEVSPNNFEFTSLVGTKEGLRRNLEIGTPLKRTKFVKGTYDKRIVDKNTGETKPIII